MNEENRLAGSLHCNSSVRMDWRACRRVVSTLAVAFLVAATACSSDGTAVAPPAPTVACHSGAPSPTTDAFALADVGVYLEGSDPMLAPVRADLATYLGAMWGGAVTVSNGAPDGTRRASVWLSSSAAAATTLGANIGEGYALRRIDAGGKTTLLAFAPDAADLAFAAYALLEELGAKFFHPKQELVPSFGAPRLPHALDVWRRPLAATRGLQPHTLHPIDYFPVFMEPGDANLADAKRFVDWLVKTGQNYVQWPLLSTVPWATWKPYMQTFMAYAHARGVQVGASPQVWGGSALQNNFVLVSDATQWASQMDAKLDQLLELPWDRIALALGEFTSADPQSVIDWLDHATEYVGAKYPWVKVDVQNHVGNYKQLWVPYDGQTLFYYHLPQFCDLRLGQSVHTLALFDLYRDWATYGHPDFHLQHDYLLGELAASRRAGYFPESAYWISADIDIPAFLPEFIHARWIDIHTLSQEIADRNLPPLDHHIEFMSGHEWGYWLTDYLVAKMLWQPDASLDDVLREYTSAFGDCADDVTTALSSYVALQSKYLFDQRLLPYIQGENQTVELGYLVGLETHPRRIEFSQLLAMKPPDRDAFEATVIAGLDAFASQSQPLEDVVSARCRGADAALAPWCDELEDGMEIVRLRAQHAAAVYRAALAYVGGDASGATSTLSTAASIRAQAATVVARRESQYRFDVARDTADYANPTVYGYGYLREAHTLCYWQRREDEVAFIVQNGVPESEASLRGCGD